MSCSRFRLSVLVLAAGMAMAAGVEAGPLGRFLPEFLIDTNITYVPAPQRQIEASVAFDGTNYFAIWTDWRGVLRSSIYGARVSQTGDVIDMQGIRVSMEVGSSAQMAFDDTNYLVIWPYNNNIHGARVSRAGELLDSQPLELAASTVKSWAIGFGGANYLLVWVDSLNGTLWGSRVTRSGQALDSGGFAIRRPPFGHLSPHVAFDGTNYLVTWDGTTGGPVPGIFGARVSQAGRVLDTAGIAIASASRSEHKPVVVSCGANFLVAWEDTAGASRWMIRGARVGPDGRVLDTLGIALSDSSQDAHNPTVAFDGHDYEAAWEESRSGLYGIRLSPAGTVVDSAEFRVAAGPSGPSSPAMASGRAGVFAVWQAQSDIWGTRIAPGRVLDTSGILVSTWSYGECLPAAAFNGTDFLVAWRQDLSLLNRFDVKAARVSQAGAVLDTLGFPVSGQSAGQSPPAVASDGTGFLVAWENSTSAYGTDIHAARLSAAGQLLDSPAIAVDTGFSDQSYPAAAFDGANYLVVWQEAHTGTGWDIRGARISPAGQVLDSRPLRISTAPSQQTRPMVAFDGTNYLVVWQDCRSGITFEIFGARVSPDGRVLDSAGIAISILGDGTSLPSVAFDGTNYLVAWQVYWNQRHDQACNANCKLRTPTPPVIASEAKQSRRTGGSGRALDSALCTHQPLVLNYSLRVARVSPAGQVIDALGVPVAPLAAEGQFAPGLAFDGTNYLIVWQDCPTGLPDIFGARVSTQGALLDTFSVERLDNAQVCPRLAHGAGNAMLLVYQGWTGTVGSKVYDLNHIWGRMGPFTGIEERLPLTACRSPLAATIIKAVLELEGGRRQGAGDRADLLDITGRKVLALKPGANDVSRLAPGVYFVCEQPQAPSLRPQAVRKVVLTR